MLKRDTLLVRTVNSLISFGTERYLTASVRAQVGMVDLAEKSLLGNALALFEPELQVPPRDFKKKRDLLHLSD